MITWLLGAALLAWALERQYRVETLRVELRHTTEKLQSITESISESDPVMRLVGGPAMLQKPARPEGFYDIVYDKDLHSYFGIHSNGYVERHFYTRGGGMGGIMLMYRQDGREYDWEVRQRFVEKLNHDQFVADIRAQHEYARRRAEQHP